LFNDDFDKCQFEEINKFEFFVVFVNQLNVELFGLEVVNIQIVFEVFEEVGDIENVS